jgi:hypothetical protein
MSARCEQCARGLVQIRLKIGGGDVIMQSCAACDRRSWIADGEPIELAGVLEQIGESRR